MMRKDNLLMASKAYKSLSGMKNVIAVRNMTIEDLERFAEKFKIEDKGCWRWTGVINAQGYGRMYVRGSDVAVHRAIYQLTKGEIPEGLVIDHLCSNRSCVNPNHLEAVTALENTLRGTLGKKKKESTHCRYGHPWIPENIHVGRSGARRCKICAKRRAREYQDFITAKRRALYPDRKRSEVDLSLSDVVNIVHTQDAVTHARTAETYGISYQTVWMIRKGYSWGWLTGVKAKEELKREQRRTLGRKVEDE